MSKILGKYLEIDTTTGLQLADDDASNWTALKAAATVGSNFTLRLPSADGSPGQILSTNGSGQLGWSNDSGGISWSDPIDSNLAPDTPDTYTLGGPGNAFSIGYINQIDPETAQLLINGPTRLPNDAYLSWRNNAGSADVDVLKVSTSDVTSLYSASDLFITSDGGSNGIVMSADSEIVRIANVNGVNPVQLQMESQNGNRVAIRPPPSLAGNYLLTLPADDGSPGQVLSTDGSGTLSWVNDASGSSWSDPVDASIVPDTDNAYYLGGPAAMFSAGYVYGLNDSSDNTIVDVVNQYLNYASGGRAIEWSSNTEMIYRGEVHTFRDKEGGTLAPIMRLYNKSGLSSWDIALADGNWGNLSMILPSTQAAGALTNNGSGILSWSVPTTGTQYAGWVKYTKTHSQLQNAATTHNVEVFQLPAKTMIQGVVVKHSTAFAGTGITGYTVSIGISGDLTKYSATFDVYQAVGATVALTTNVMDFESYTGATSIRIAAESVGADLDQSTAGSVDVWFLLAELP